MITVVGSINMDVVTVVDKYPLYGETKIGKSVEMLPGGKGANQAATCGKLGASVALIGCVGNDQAGDLLVQSLKENNVSDALLARTDEASTGTVIVTIDETAENTMIVIKGANERLTKTHIDACEERIKASSVLLVQMEVPHDVVLYAMEIAKKHGVYIILDPAPAEGLTLDMVKHADLITPNRQETRHLTGIDVTDEATANEAAKRFEQAGVKSSIIKMAEQGSVLYTEGKAVRIEGIRVNAVSTVGAGDSFAGALAAALDDGATLLEAARFATAVSALKVTRLGAQKGLPTRSELEAFCRERGIPLDGRKNEGGVS